MHMVMWGDSILVTRYHYAQVQDQADLDIKICYISRSWLFVI